MSADESAAWHEYVKDKLAGEGDWLNLAGFDQRLAELAAENLSDNKQRILGELGQYGAELKTKYGLA
jgi:hypothetical protein